MSEPVDSLRVLAIAEEFRRDAEARGYPIDHLEIERDGDGYLIRLWCAALGADNPATIGVGPGSEDSHA